MANRTWISFRLGWSEEELARLIWGITGRRPGPSSSRPHNLPRLPFFFGREDELARILEALDPANRSWGALIDGPGGIGKTALAIRAAERSPTDWFDRIVFVSAKVRDLSAQGEVPVDDACRSWAELLGELASLLGQTDVDRLEGEARRKAVLAALGQGRCLLVLDNLESLPEPDQRRIFLFLDRLPAGNKAIVTSRARRDSSGRPLRLARLEQSAALELLAGLAPGRPHLERARADWPALWRETGGNPLLLRWLAGQLGRGKCRDAASALAFLRAAPPDNDPLEYIFGDLARSFTEEEAKVLGALYHFQGPVPLKLVATLAGLTTMVAEPALLGLADRALVEADAAEGEFVLGALVGVYLRRSHPDAVRTSGDRLCDRVLAVVLENSSHPERYPAIEAARAEIEAAMPRFLEEENGRLQRLCDALSLPADDLGWWAFQAGYSEVAERRAVDAGDLRKAGWRAYDAGFAHHRLG
ncbi:MAG TPA: ATP-binding protein, partial [Myxococcota bacterium]|nr:ATP-binding protein [Myxococcota bacterium]